MTMTAVADALPSDERYTPQEVLDVVREFAPIGLDPCTIASNPTRARACFTREDDGLTRAWAPMFSPLECVFVNPPYSRGLLDFWAGKVLLECGAAPGLDIIMLTPCDLGTRWATKLCGAASMYAGWRRRISFIRPDGSYETGAKQASLFWYFGERASRFARVFRSHANVAAPHR